MAGQRGPGGVLLLTVAGLAAAGLYVATSFSGLVATFGLFVMVFGIVLFFLGVLF
jgi:hypothetical protein